MRGAQKILLDGLSERDFTSTVVSLAKLYGWMVCHYRPARTERGWRTAVEGDQGSPDLLLARDGVVLLAELKSSKGRLGPGQAEWATHLGEHYRIWRPADLDEIKETLRGDT